MHYHKFEKISFSKEYEILEDMYLVFKEQSIFRKNPSHGFRKYYKNIGYRNGKKRFSFEHISKEERSGVLLYEEQERQYEADLAFEEELAAI